MKLSKRLACIEQMITSEYTHIWDCCCDHGFLGTALLSRQAANVVHFADIVPELISSVSNKLNQHYSNLADCWETHCIDVAQLPLSQYEGKHLVIIAGVGGDLVTELVEKIATQHPQLEVDFLLCPVRNQFLLREKLIELHFSLKQELLVKENQKFYEIIYVANRSEAGRELSPVGNEMWLSETDEQAQVAKEYLENTLNHYRRIQQGKLKKADHIVAAYESV